VGHEDALFLGPPGTGKSHLAQAIGQAAIQQGYRVLCRETHTLLDELAEATLDGTRKEHMEFLVTVPLLILDDLGMRKLPLTAAEELLEIIMRRYERASTRGEANGQPSSPAAGSSHRQRQVPITNLQCDPRAGLIPQPCLWVNRKVRIAPTQLHAYYVIWFEGKKQNWENVGSAALTAGSAS
jgi:hypothetical protein